MDMQYLFTTIRKQNADQRIVRVKSDNPPDCECGHIYNVTTESSVDMDVTATFRVDGLIKRETDAEGNHYAWYAVSEVTISIDRKPALDTMQEQIVAVEDAACEMDEVTDERLTAIEDALCELDEMLNGTE